MCCLQATQTLHLMLFFPRNYRNGPFLFRAKQRWRCDYKQLSKKNECFKTEHEQVSLIMFKRKVFNAL